MNKIIRDTKKITRIAEKAQVNIEKGKITNILGGFVFLQDLRMQANC